MPLSRRQLLKASGVALCASMLPNRAYAASETKLPIPPLLEAVRAQPLFLSLQRAQWQFTPDNRTAVWGFNGLYLGPTVRVKRGDNTKLICNNQLDQPVSMSLSGLQLPGAVIGNPARMIQSGANWAPILPIRQSAATCWYHANTPSMMGNQVYNGLAGMWIVDDPEQANFNLPRQYGLDDIPVIIQDKRFTYSGALEYNPADDRAFYGDVLIANGVENAFVEVPRGWIRLRLLNASNARRYDLQLSNGQPFRVIASDLGLLAAPVNVLSLSIAPGERWEVLVDMTQEKELSVVTGGARRISERLRAMFETSDTLRTNNVLTLKATGLAPAIVLPIAERFSADYQLQTTSTTPRQITLNSDPATVNGVSWDPKRIDFQLKQGSVERWIVTADTPQSFHLQGAEFLLQSRDGKAISAEDHGWKDTVWVNEQVELLARFTQISSAEFPFLYGSQTLEFAARGAVGQMVAVG